MKFLSFATVFSIAATATATRDRSKNGEMNCYNCGNKNPCDPLLTEGLFYYPRCNKPAKFVQCSDDGGCDVRPCPDGLVWDQSILTCVREVDTSTECFSCEENSPCSPLAVPDKYYYTGCTKEDYVQCSSSGSCYDMSCPSSTTWDDDVLSCVHK
uniref:Chitin-binding type-2 domain-containing protein n=1 Tax=Helicotheca tamesis TaxID=374047 RepID=A0A7S2IGA4_9STRA